MNDLAEKALLGLGATRRAIGARPMLGFGVLGFAFASLVVVAGGQVAAAESARPPTHWLGLQDPHPPREDDTLAGLLMLLGIVALIVLWLVVVAYLRRRRPLERAIWPVAAAWATPFVLGPPLLDTTLYSYTAFGLLQRDGGDPYRSGATHLGAKAIVAAIDPAARGTPSALGPLGTLGEHLAVSISAGSAMGAVLLLRAAGALVTVVLGRLAADAAGADRTQGLALTVLNPLVLLYIVSAAHLDGLMIAFTLAAILAAGQRRWSLAVALAGLATSVSGQAIVAVLAIIVVHQMTSRGRASRWWRLARDVAVGVVTIGVVGLIVPDGFGWLRTVDKQFATHTPFSIAGATAKLLSPIVRGASYDDLADGARMTAIIAMVALIGYLLATARGRPLDRTIGYSLLATGLLAPALYPWYLLWGTLCLAPAAQGERRIAVLALCAAGCLLTPPGFATGTANGLTTAALVVVPAVTAVVLVRRYRRTAEGTAPEAVTAGT